MACYKFTYKDVLKRYERIINKPSKFEIRLFATILLIITIVNISSLCFAAEVENVDFNIVNGIIISSSKNYFDSNPSNNVGYFNIEEGYKYTITNNNNSQFARQLAWSDSIPVLNGTYNYIQSLSYGESYSFISNSNSYLYFSFSNTPDVVVTRERIEGQTGAINDLVENVGISQIWDIFDTGIGFVGVVVLFAFGIFLIVIAIKKVSKGKSDF